MRTIAQPPGDPLIQLIRDHASPRLIFLALSGERDLWHALTIKAERRGYREGHQHGHARGWQAGYNQAEADIAAGWARVAEPVAHPERGLNRRLAAALAGERRDQADHELAHLAAVAAVPARYRNPVQRATARLYARQAKP